MRKWLLGLSLVFFVTSLRDAARGSRASRAGLTASQASPRYSFTGAPHHDEPGNAVLSRRAMTDDRGSWLELLEIHDADATIWEVVVACPECGMRQNFRGTESEISDSAEAWKKGHQCAAP